MGKVFFMEDRGANDNALLSAMQIIVHGSDISIIPVALLSNLYVITI